jgi:hypothetical protein
LQRAFAGSSEAPGNGAAEQGFIAFGELLLGIFDKAVRPADPTAFMSLWETYAGQAAGLFAYGAGFDVPGATRLGAIADQWAEVLRRGGGANPIGPGREWQLKVHAVEQAMVAWTGVQAKIQVAQSAVVMDAWRELGVYLMAQASSPPGLRAIYDHWITCAEQAYRRRVMQPDYARQFGDAVNAFVALQAAVQDLTDDVLHGMHLPSHGELNALYRRVQQMEQELRRGRTAPERPADTVTVASGQPGKAKRKATGKSRSRPASRRPPAKPANRERRPAGSDFDIDGI